MAFRTVDSTEIPVTVNGQTATSGKVGESIFTVANRAAMESGLVAFDVLRNGQEVLEGQEHALLVAGDTLAIRQADKAGSR